MDECTANVDSGTDRLIQESVRTQFRDATVLTIAHRLDTVVTNDRILVMPGIAGHSNTQTCANFLALAKGWAGSVGQVLDAGRIVEFDAPHRLLQNPASYFCQLVEQAGPEAAARLRQMAAEAYARAPAPPTPA